MIHSRLRFEESTLRVSIEAVSFGAIFAKGFSSS